MSLSRGNRVQVLTSERGFSRVRLGDGREGYIASANLRFVSMAERQPSPAAQKRPKGGPATVPEPTSTPHDALLSVPAGTDEPPRPRFRF